MSDDNGNGHIHLLGDRKSAKPSKAETDKQMVDAVQNIAIVAARKASIEVCEFYLNQMPELVAKMLAEAFQAQGMELKPPPVTLTDTTMEPQ